MFQNTLIGGLISTLVIGVLFTLISPVMEDSGIKSLNLGLEVNPNPVYLCGPGDSPTLTASFTSSCPACTIDWFDGSMGFLASGTSITVSSAGTYFAVATSADGMTSQTVSVNVISDFVTVEAGADQTICQGDPLVLTGSGASTYQWIPSGICLDPPNCSTVQVSPNPPSTVYYLIGENASGCTGIDSVRITVNPSYNVTQTASICEGESIFLGGAFQTTSNTYLDFYSTTSGCDSIIFTSLTVHPLQSDTVQRTICAGESILLGGSNQTTAGIYTDILVDQNGCDSTVLSILTVIDPVYTNLAQSVCDGDSLFIGGIWQFNSGTYNDTLTAYSGCDSILVNDVSFLPNSTTILDEFICDGDCYVLDGVSYCTTGNYEAVFPKFNGCDSTVQLNLTVLPNSFTSQDIEICAGESYFAGGGNQNSSGLYQDVLLASNGCDSTVTTNLIVLDTSLITQMVNICEGQSYFFEGISYSTTGTYNSVYNQSNGCDSTRQLILTVLDTALTVQDIQICTGESFFAGGALQSTPGTYTDIYPSSNACDSTVITHLSLNPVFESVSDLTICQGQSIFLEGENQTTSGIYRDTIFSMGACDTVLINNLTVVPNDTISENISICTGASYPAGGANQTTSGTYYTNNPGAGTAGCDQVIETVLFVIPQDTVVENVLICQGDSYPIGGSQENTSGTYFEIRPGQGTGACDLIAEIQLTVLNPNQISQDVSICENESIFLEGAFQMDAGTYIDTFTNVFGCDSIVTSNLSVLSVPQTIFSEQICFGENFAFEGNTYSNSGIYQEIYTAQNGCDSVIILDLDVLAEITNDLPLTAACPGSPVNYNGTDYFNSVIFNDTLTASNGCDSILRVDVLIPALDTNYVTLDTCVVDTSGIALQYPYTTIDQDINGCDSITVVDVDIADIVVTVLAVDTTLIPGDSLLINGTWYYFTGVYTDTIPSDNCPELLIITVGETTHIDIMDSLDVCIGDMVNLGGIPADTSGLYVYTVPQVSTCCDTTYFFDVTIRDTFYLEQDIFICEGDSVPINGLNVGSPGIYTENLNSIYGCDSVVVSTLSVLDTSLLYQDVVICQGESFFAAGGFQNFPGLYRDSYIGVNGCDSTVLTNLIVNPTSSDVFNVDLCANDSIQIGTVFYNQPGIVYDTLANQFSCDSIIAYDINILQNPILTYQFEGCAGDIFSVHGFDFTEEGLFYETIPGAVGACDTIVEVNITFIPFRDTLLVEICEGESYYAGGDFQTEQSWYRDTILVPNACDTIRLTKLFVFPTYQDTINAQICVDEFFYAGGSMQNTSGTYTDHYFTDKGCDSIIITELIVDTIKFGNLDIEICAGDAYFVGGALQSSPGFYTDTIPVSLVCDSVLITNLIVHPIDTTYLQAEICDGDSIFLGGNWRSIAGIYTDLDHSWDTGCDSVLLTDLIVHPNLSTNLNETICEWDSIYLAGAWQSTAGLYVDSLQTFHGCDSILFTQLDLTPVSYVFDTTSICSGDAILLGGSLQSQAGTYLDTIQNPGACYEVLETELFILPVYQDSFRYEICQGDSILIEGAYQSNPGFYSNDYFTQDGCDSTVISELIVHPHVLTFEDVEICQGESLMLGGMNQFFSGFYVDTLNTIHGCDSIVTTNLTVNPINYQVLTDTICFGDCIDIGGSSICGPGTYTNVYQNQFNCDSTVITLVTMLQNSSSFVDTLICQGSSIYLDGAARTSPGIYTDVFTNYLGCDSTVITNLGIIPSVYDTISTSICYGDSLFLENEFQTTAGFYNDTLTSIITGCDSVLTTELILRDTFFTNLIDYYCANDPDLIGLPIGVQYDTLSAFNGCDSVIATGVAVLPISQSVQAITICDDESIFIGGAEQNTTGSYLDTLVNTIGCDSIILTKLTVLETPETNLDIQICAGETYTAGGIIQSSPGIYTDTLVAFNTCDSIVITNLMVADTFYTERFESICESDSLFLEGSWQNQNGWYYDVYSSITGCDSTIATNLNIIPTLSTNVEVNICQGETYLAGGWHQFTSGMYQDTLIASSTGCDSIIITDLTVLDTFQTNITLFVCENEPGAEAGIFTENLQSQFGCDSTVITEVILQPILETFVDQSICDNDSIFLSGDWQQSAGVYVDTLQSSFGCDSIRYTDLSILATFQTNSFVNLCEGDSIFLSGDWQLISGDYIDPFIAQNGCDSIHTTSVYFAPNYLIPQEATICEGDSILLGGAFRYDEGVYYDSLQTTLQCDSVIQTSLFVINTLETFLVDTICAGESILLGGALQTEPGIYADWYTSTSTSCDSVVYTNLSVLEIEVPAEYEICIGDSVQLEAIGGLEYFWKPGRDLSCQDCPNPIASPSETTTYTVSDLRCSETEWPVTVIVHPLPEVTAFSSSNSVLRFETVTLSATGSSLSLQYDWFDALGNLICSDCQETTYEVREDTRLSVMATDLNGCSAFDEVMILSRDQCEEVEVFAPNIITPNGDGLNDVFYVETTALGSFDVLRIYNRWGELVFESTQEDSPWDGTFRGQVLNPDTFVFYFEGTCLNGDPYIHKGAVTLIK